MMDRFMDKVEIENPNACWKWKATKMRGKMAYGQFREGSKMQLAHRVSFKLFFGYLPPVVMHKCDNPSCVNPAHLEAGTYATNNMDCVLKKRQRQVSQTHCVNGHELSGENVKIYAGKRKCLACDRIRAREYRRGVRARNAS